MAANVKPIPEGYHSVTPYLVIKGAAKAIAFYKKAFGAKEIGQIAMQDGRVMHAEIQIGNSRIMLADEHPEWGTTSPSALGGTSVELCVYVENVDEVFNNAVDAGASVLEGMEVKDQFYGDRSGTVVDPFGHRWILSTNIEDVSFEEVKRRMEDKFSKQEA